MVGESGSRPDGRASARGLSVRGSTPKPHPPTLNQLREYPLAAVRARSGANLGTVAPAFRRRFCGCHPEPFSAQTGPCLRQACVRALRIHSAKGLIVTPCSALFLGRPVINRQGVRRPGRSALGAGVAELDDDGAEVKDVDGAVRRQEIPGLLARDRAAPVEAGVVAGQV